jgi:hypothetical protein
VLPSGSVQNASDTLAAMLSGLDPRRRATLRAAIDLLEQLHDKPRA